MVAMRIGRVGVVVRVPVVKVHKCERGSTNSI